MDTANVQCFKAEQLAALLASMVLAKTAIIYRIISEIRKRNPSYLWSGGALILGFSAAAEDGVLI